MIVRDIHQICMCRSECVTFWSGVRLTLKHVHKFAKSLNLNAYLIHKQRRQTKPITQVQPGTFPLMVSENRIQVEHMISNRNSLKILQICDYAIWKATASNDCVIQQTLTKDLGTFPLVLIFFECFSFAIRILCLLGILFERLVGYYFRKNSNSGWCPRLATIHCRFLTYAKEGKLTYSSAALEAEIQLMFKLHRMTAYSKQ